MFIDTAITVDILKEAGFTRWLDFVHSITGYSSSKGLYTYQYKNENGEKGEITLDITPRNFERLAVMEAKLVLTLMNISSFMQLKELLAGDKIRFDGDAYFAEVVVRTKEGQILLKRIKFQVDDIDRLVSWEEKYKDEAVYVEKMNI